MRRQFVLVCVLLATAFSAAASFDFISYADIVAAAATLTTNRIDGSDGVTNQLTPGTIVLYQTNEGRYGKFQVLEYGFNLKIQWHTFRPNETRHSSGELVVRGTFECDLDAGREGSASADFQWRMVSATERYLEPANGARFAVYGAAPPPDLGIWIDKQQYTPGETISFTLTIPDDCDYRVMLTQPNGTSAQFTPTLSSALISAPGYMTIHMTGTTGTQTGVYTATLLCTTPPGPIQLGQVQYSVGTAGVGAAAELAYDDGTAETTRGWTVAGRGYAVRFTPPASGGNLVEARFYINGFSPGGAGPIEVRVWDASRNLVNVPVVVTPTQPGWFSVELVFRSAYVPTGDFYVGYVQLSATAHPWIGMDTSGGEGRSYNVHDWSAVPPQGANIMIRAVLSAPPAPPSSGGASIATDKAQYVLGETVVFTVFSGTGCAGASIRVHKPDGSTTVTDIGSLGANQTATVAGPAGLPQGLRTAVLYCGGAPVAQITFTVGAGTSGTLSPPFPGLDPGDFVPGVATITPNGSRTAALGSGFQVTVAGFPGQFTTVKIAERRPNGVWSVATIWGFLGGSATANWVADMRGTFEVIAWVDLNGNDLVDPGELTVPWLTVTVP